MEVLQGYFIKNSINYERRRWLYIFSVFIDYRNCMYVIFRFNACSINEN